MRFTGKIHTWHAARGFGFIRPTNGGQDIYVHISNLPRGRADRDELLSFEVSLNRDGKKKAVNVCPAVAEPAPAPAAATPAVAGIEQRIVRLTATLDGLDNFGGYFPQYRDLNDSHCTTIVDFQNGDIQEQELDPATVRLRVGVKGGGCSGFSYVLDLTDNQMETDELFEQHGVRIICDPKSLLYLEGVTVDFRDEIMGRGFVFNNPNATSTCGCGSSFQA